MSHDHHHDHSHHQEQTPMNMSMDMQSMGGHEQHNGGENSGGDSVQHHMMMSMWFHAGYDETILFQFWKISDIGGLIGSIVFIFFLAFAYEALKFYRELLYRRSFRAVQYNTVTVPVENGGAVKETHKTVQISDENGGGPFFQPEVIVPIYFSQMNCSCNLNGAGAQARPGVSAEHLENPADADVQSGPPIPSILTLHATNYSSVSCPSCGKRADNFKIPNIHRAYKVKMFSVIHAWQTVLHLVQTIISYFLMLIFMTYNIWLCL
ncbi:unnamed protein product, partial [Allacma fusca]